MQEESLKDPSIGKKFLQGDEQSTVAQNEICGQSDVTKVFPVDFTWDIHGYDEKMCPGNI